MRILLVDDIEAILDLLKQSLTRAGHEVVTASGVQAALQTVESEAALDAAVVDLVLPDGSGEEVARRVLEKHKQARVIMVSGYPYEPPASLAGNVETLQKPFMPRVLLQVLAQRQ